MLKKLLFAFFVMVAGAAQAFVPQSGTWVVTSELNGLPGRGIALDVQDTTIGMQIYAYEYSGQPTFYMGVGDLSPRSTASFPLKRYTGGRYFGSGPRSGVEAGTAGTVQLRFTSGTTGFAIFPGEYEVAISRLNFAYGLEPNSLKGTWMFTSWDGISGGSTYADVHTLKVNRPATANGNGVVATADGLLTCEHQTSGVAAGFVKCNRFGSSKTLLRSYIFKYSVNEGDGYEDNADGSWSRLYVFVKRVRTPGPDGRLTGILLD